jgi:hypothetical protein
MALGDYTVNFTNAMPDANYAVCLTATCNTEWVWHNLDLYGNNNIFGLVLTTANIWNGIVLALHHNVGAALYVGSVFR